MIDTIQTKLAALGSAIYGAFTWPGDYALSYFMNWAPAFSAGLESSGRDAIVIFVFALVYWYLVIALLTILWRTMHDVVRNTSAMIRTFKLVLAHELGSLKTRVVCKFRKRRSWEKVTTEDEPETTEFNKLDYAILRTAARRGAGLALSAPDIAEKYRLRPAQAQSGLDKLVSNKLMESVLGSTDGYDNYRLTDAGLSFLAMLARSAGTNSNDPSDASWQAQTARAQS